MVSDIISAPVHRHSAPRGDGWTARWLLRRQAVLVLTIALTSAAVSFSQSVAGDLFGMITDATGGAVGGATISVVSLETARVRAVKADAAGRYVVPVLAAGDYRIEVEADRFGKATRSVRLAVGEAAVVDFELQVAEVKETVLVVSAASPASPGLGGVIDRTQIADLPLNGRDLERLALLEAGVFATTNRNSTALYTHGTKLTINGAGPRSNAFLLDGTTTADFFNNGFGSVAGPVLGVDAVREFRVMTGGYGAVYGGVAGGIVSIVTKSGTNSFRGSLFEFFRNDTLDARDYFDTEKPDFSRHQFGFSVGGPIVSNRAFFFGTGEGLYERLGLTQVTTVPSVAARAGLLPDLTRPGATVAVSPSVKPYLDLFPLPNGRDFGDGLAEYSFAETEKSTEGFGQVRVDHTITPSLTLFGRYTVDDASKNEPARYPGLPIDWNSRFHFVTIQGDQVIGDRLVNTMRFGFSRTTVAQTDAGPRNASPSLAVIPGRPLPQLQIGGMPNFGTLTASETRATQNVYSIADELIMSGSRHLVKVGGLIERYDAASDYQFFWGGRYTFPSVQRFLQARPSVMLISLPGSDSFREIASTQFGVHAQDEFRVSSNLTLNAGVRWEFSTEPTEARDLLVGLHDPLHDTDVTVGTLFRNHKANVGPRLAFSWRPLSRTVVSGGAGRFFDIKTLPYVAQLLNNPPYFHQVTIANPAFPNTSFGADVPPSLSVPSYDWKTPQMLHFNISIERELGWGTAVTASYAGSRGTHLVRTSDANAPVPEVLADGQPFFPAGAPRRNQRFGAIEFRATDGRSSYDALLVSVRRRLGSGLQFQGSYTLSKTIDDVQGTLPTEALGSVTRALDPDNPERDRGLADFHRRHNLQVNAVWQLPFFRSRDGVAGELLRGWTVSGILAALSGNPFTPGIQADYSRTLARVAVGRPDWNPQFAGDVVRGGPEQYFDSAAFKLPAPGMLGSVGRNTLIGPGLVTLDTAAFKEVPWGRRQARLQFRIEVFNLLNHTNFGLPQRIVFAGSAANEPPLANAGRITTTTTSARQVQLAVKLLW